MRLRERLIRSILGVLFGLLAEGAGAQAGSLTVTSPAHRTLITRSSVFLEVRNCSGLPRKTRLEVMLDGKRFEGKLRALPYGGTWGVELANLSPGQHWVHVSGYCPKGESASSEFTVLADTDLEPAVRLARQFLAKNPIDSQKWDWEEAVFWFGLERLAAALGPEKGQPFLAALQQYQKHWLQKGLPAIDRSDRCPAALTALSLATDWNDSSVLSNASRVADYLKAEPRNELGTLDHLGHSWLRHFYPRSIWVDSLMMYGVFAARWAEYTGDEVLREFAAAQPLLFSFKLQDPESGFFRHAWLTHSARAVPKKPAFWLRGNAWVLASIVEILEVLPQDHPKRPALQEVFTRLARALAGTQLANGAWDSLANLPGYSYPETSGTALVSASIHRAIRQGWLDRSFLPMAERAYRAVSSRLLPGDSPGTFSMPGISGPTNPISKLSYKLVPEKADLGYGVGSFLLAAVEMHELSRRSVNP